MFLISLSSELIELLLTFTMQLFLYETLSHEYLHNNPYYKLKLKGSILYNHMQFTSLHWDAIN